MAPRWLHLALLAFSASAGVTLAADSSSSSECGNDGKVMLTKGEKDNKAIVYAANCTKTVLDVDDDNKLSASSMNIEVVDSIPDCAALYMPANSLTSFPALDGVDSLTTLTLTSNYFSSWDDITVPSSVTYLDLSWNSLSSFDGMTLPSTLAKLFIGGNKFTSLSDVEFPESLTLLYVHDLPLSNSLDGANLPSTITYLSLVNSGVKTLDNVELPSSLTNMDLTNNSLTALPDDLPSSMEELIAVTNKLTEIANISFPKTITSLNFSDNQIETVLGVSFPWNLEKLDFGSHKISTFEISRSDYSTFSKLTTFNANVAQTSCSTSGAELTDTLGIQLCVISDDTFSAIYGTGSSGSSSSATTSTGSDDSGSTSTLLIVVVCLSAVLALALAVIGFRLYRTRQLSKSQQLADSHFFGNHTGMSTVHGSNSGQHSNPTGPSGSGVNNSSYTFNTIFSGGKVTMMGGSNVESTLVKYRIPQQDIKIEKPIAKGGFGMVFLATYQKEHVVLKKLLPEKASDDRCLTAFIEEIKLCSTLTHDKIVRFIGVCWSMLTDMAVVLEYMPNGDLDVLLKKQFERQKNHPEEFDWYQNSSVLPAKATLALDILDAVVYLHSFSSPIIHRDLKAKNVLLSKSYEAKLSDFGISREWKVDATMTAGIGTMAWIAPEVLRGERYTEKADIYSFGVILSELSTCAKPFEGVTNALIVLKVTSEEKPSMGKNCPEDIRELADRCLSYNASDRPSAMVAHYELRTLLKLHTAFEL